MTIQTINIGASAGDGTGDTLRTAFDKANDNFAELAASIASPTVADDSITNAKLANVATATIKGRTTAGTGDPEDLTATQATALLNAVVGDSGSGGTKGLVPAPAAGDAAAGKLLGAGGSWIVVAYAAVSALVATAAQIWANTASKLVSVAGLWSAQAFVTITYSSTPTIDGSAGVNFIITLTGNPTFAAPTAMKDGQGVLLKMVQDATGSRVPSWNAAFDWGVAGAPTLSTGAGKVDYASGIYDATRSKLVMGMFLKAA